MFPNSPPQLGFKIIEVGHDFVAVRNASGLLEASIAICAIKSITTVKAKEH